MTKYGGYYNVGSIIGNTVLLKKKCLYSNYKAIQILVSVVYLI